MILFNILPIFIEVRVLGIVRRSVGIIHLFDCQKTNALGRYDVHRFALNLRRLVYCDHSCHRGHVRGYVFGLHVTVPFGNSIAARSPIMAQ